MTKLRPFGWSRARSLNASVGGSGWICLRRAGIRDCCEHWGPTTATRQARRFSSPLVFTEWAAWLSQQRLAPNHACATWQQVDFMAATDKARSLL